MRVKNCAFICYPENGHFDELKQYLTQASYRGAISPLHVPDNEDKKEHYHVLIALSSPRELKSLNDEFQPFGCTMVQRVGSKNSYSRYLVHLDSPEKQQFSDGLHSVFTFGGFDIFAEAYRSPTACDYVSIMDYIFKMYNSGAFEDYGSAVMFATQEQNIELLEFLIAHAYSMSQVLNTYNK